MEEDAYSCGEEAGNLPSASSSRFSACKAPLMVMLYVLAAVAGVGLVARLTVRDRFMVSALFYYAVPYPYLVLTAAFWTVWAAIQKRKALIAGLVVTVLALSCTWYAESYYSRNEQAPDTLRVMFWNTARFRFGLEPVIGHVRKQNADIVGLVEADVEGAAAMDRLQKEFPDYVVRALPGGMLLLTRGEVESIRSTEVTEYSRVNLIELTVRQKRLTLAIVDVESNPFYRRGPVIEGIFEECRGSSQSNRVVMGDFNTPVGSVHFEPVRRKWTHAFESGGEGWIETWPSFLPALAIDHIWVRGNLQVRNCKNGTAWCSDHQSVIADLQLGKR